MKYLTDENLHDSLLDTLRAAGLDVERVQDVGLDGTPDPEILEWAAAEARVFITFDKKTVPRFAAARVSAGLPLGGVIIIDKGRSLEAIVEDILTLGFCETPEGLAAQVVKYLPL